MKATNIIIDSICSTGNSVVKFKTFELKNTTYDFTETCKCIFINICQFRKHSLVATFDKVLQKEMQV